MSDIERCRTAALGGHVEQCDACGHQRIAFNSCLMVTTSLWGAGLAVDCRTVVVSSGKSVSCLHYERALGTVRWAAHGLTHMETSMLENFFSAPKTLCRLRSGPSGPYIDGFAAELSRTGYSGLTAVRYLRAASHLGFFVQRTRAGLEAVDATTLKAFTGHFARCRCRQSRGDTTGYHDSFGAKLFHGHLCQLGICRGSEVGVAHVEEPALVTAFRSWLQAHRGASKSTVRLYARDAAELVKELGEGIGTWTVGAVRGFVIDRAARCGIATTQKRITSLRSFLRFLNASGQSSSDLADAVPAVASWRLARLPRHLSEDELARLIATCDDPAAPSRVRDRAILLLLARLGLRAGDVAQLRLGDIDWRGGTLLVAGKGRYQVRLPLPQDVGDALLAYMDGRPKTESSDRVFLRSIAPVGPFKSGDGVSSVVEHALRRAGITSPAKGAHLLRHTAATQMLRNGVPLDQIGLVLRHRSLDMTAYYAKVDKSLLRGIAQPWPKVRS
jgi:site-specific recombinase XerD